MSQTLFLWLLATGHLLCPLLASACARLVTSLPFKDIPLSNKAQARGVPFGIGSSNPQQMFLLLRPEESTVQCRYRSLQW
ncbi:uncharacterized protein M421DRAFT_421578 [Didymella exigua CBS 183.55]|uniref:Uncharacterized protein n=1 Tax=Didymella exigua CBS 183.55 TaxID=1150837 RepID=A0A6A5RHD9_9PLEO|nr:uncharacterized protein M421DRAFT_421578 [Didymella exigua CBS 183.55]KAF1927735.1 hypothetical protein M421DRAFT_421578 [Didymella exigua CBS 183.55]